MNAVRRAIWLEYIKCAAAQHGSWCECNVCLASRGDEKAINRLLRARGETV